MEILYQDNDLLAINKPSGISTLPEGWAPSIPHVRSLLESMFGPLWIVHRLDKETSGVLLLARNAAAHKNLNDQFASRQTKKVYTCLVFGQVKEATNCALPLLINADRRHRTIVDLENGKPAMTNFEPLHFLGNNSSQLNVMPETGYTHQIRIHCLSLGFPILGDPLYFTPESKSFSLENSVLRTMLHAMHITFAHPINQSKMTISAPLQEDFLSTISALIK
jgi:RluA family pseudouridine synthase